MISRLLLTFVALCALPLLAAPPVARWEFGSEETSKLIAHGGVHRDVAGPRPPEYPDFDATNTAVKLDGSGARFTLEDTGVGSPFVFTNGDSISLEAWVNVEEMKKGENQYVIGKGRTGAAGFARDNQNWALRLRESKGQACISFLFATDPAGAGDKKDAHWHRWTTNTGFAFGKGWHHVAVSYKFGEPESVRGWIDGKPLPGAWDMGGSSKAAPVADADAIWIGSSQGGSAGNSFRGSLDSIAVHREVLTDEVMRARFRREAAPAAGSATAPIVKAAPEAAPDLGDLPPGQVLASFHEGLPAHNRWLNADEKTPKETARWLGENFLFPRLPYRYDAWGIRESWKGPVLTRLASDMVLEPGKHRFLLRARGLSRLWVNGEVVARTKTVTGSSDGHQAVPPLIEPPLPGLRPMSFEMQESYGEITLPKGGVCRVILETIVGGAKFRAEPGELCVAVLSADGTMYKIASPRGGKVALTDSAMTADLARIESALDAHDDQTRRSLAATQDAFWKSRHDRARDYAQSHPAAAVPPGAAHPIDAFLKSKIDRAVAEAAKSPADQAAFFHKNIRPILQDQCFRCHGDKEKGGLKLDSREAALKPGESKKPAIVPGNPAASEMLVRLRSDDESERMPPKGEGLKPEQIAILEAWIKSGAPWPAPPVAAAEVAAPPVIDDAAFLRRLSLDTRGTPPTEVEVRNFLTDKSPDKRPRAIDRLLADDGWADHWISYWQDVLAENPNMLKPSLNNTGPFRWFLHESLRDNKPLDRMATELIMLRGSEREGGSAGFGLAADNDAPFAAKGHIVATAFLGIELQCARCHDSPYHSTKQSDLYQLAAMFSRKTVTVPKTSTVPAGFFEKKTRESLIKVTLKPGTPVKPVWPFAEVTGCVDDASLDALLQQPTDTRERLAALVTAPQNTRFARMMANRIWRRLIGAGFVEPAHDWEGHAASHPELLDWLAKELITNNYDAKHLARLILTSQTYQRAATGNNLKASPELRFFAAPEPRRLSAEQVVDSLYAAAGQPIDVEEITFDPEGRRPANSMISLGFPRRAWMFASLSNERDRPSLSLPRAQAVTDVLEAFGWTGSRQSPRTDRETDPNVLQPGVLANSLVSVWVTRASQGSQLADLAVNASTPESLVESIFLRFLGRPPNAQERATFIGALAENFGTRVIPPAEVQSPAPPSRLARVTWSNHLMPDANSIKMEMERRARAGTPPDPRLRAAWREVYEDVVWSVVNDREFVWLP